MLRQAVAAYAPPPRPVPYASRALPWEDCGYQDATDPVEKIIVDLLRRGNLPQAEILVRSRLVQNGNPAKALNCLGWIAAAVGLPEPAIDYFEQASELAPAWQQPQLNLGRVRRPGGRSRASRRRRHIEAISVDQGLGIRILVRRQPRGQPAPDRGVDGADSHRALGVPTVFSGTEPLSNAFDAYFEPVSTATTDDLRHGDWSIWPPKWNDGNLLGGDVHKSEGTIFAAGRDLPAEPRGADRRSGFLLLDSRLAAMDSETQRLVRNDGRRTVFPPGAEIFAAEVRYFGGRDRCLRIASRRRRIRCGPRPGVRQGGRDEGAGSGESRVSPGHRRISRALRHSANFPDDGRFASAGFLFEQLRG